MHVYYITHYWCAFHYKSDAVSISVVLGLDYDQYLKEEAAVRSQLEAAFRGAGVDIVDIKATKFSDLQ